MMRLTVELYAEKPLFIKENSIFKLGLRTGGLVLEESIGVDRYKLACMALSGRRIAGCARELTYDYTIFPCGMGSGEARPGAYVEVDEGSLRGMAIILETNLVLDVGLARDGLGLRLVNSSGKSYDLPLARPDVEVHWDGRGRYVIPVGEFVTSRLFRPK